MSAPCTKRRAQLGALFSNHDARLQRVVARGVAAQPATIADACSHAWTQLLEAEHIDLDVAWAPLAWLTTTAVREAWRLNALEWQSTPSQSAARLAAVVAAERILVPRSPSEIGASPPLMADHQSSRTITHTPAAVRITAAAVRHLSWGRGNA